MPINHPSFGKLEEGRVIIFDTTLRDGEQSPGFSMNLNEKVRMAEALTELGVDVLEAGFAIASPGDFESVKTIAETIGQRPDSPVLASLSRAGSQDVLASANALKAAKRKRIHIVIATSDLHMEHKLRLTRDEVIAATVESIKLARQHADDVEWSAEDATRSDIDFLARCCEAAIKAGATTINLPDTVGYAMPEDMERMYIQIREKVPGIENVNGDLDKVTGKRCTFMCFPWRWPEGVHFGRRYQEFRQDARRRRNCPVGTRGTGETAAEVAEP